MAEMVLNCELAEIGRDMGCQMMVEGPSHVPLDEIEANIILEKRMSGGAPDYVLGPLPADRGAGYDHITAAIGAAEAARYPRTRHGARLASARICSISGSSARPWHPSDKTFLWSLHQPSRAQMNNPGHAPTSLIASDINLFALKTVISQREM